MSALKIIASPIQTIVQSNDSLKETECALRWNMPRSIASMSRIKRIKKIQNVMSVVIDKFLNRGKDSKYIYKDSITIFLKKIIFAFIINQHYEISG